MKKVLLFAAMVVVFSSCSKDDEPSKSIKMDSPKLSLNVDDSKKLTVTLNGVESSTIKWDTSNDFVADVDANGNVEAEHVGTATVYVASENLIDSCLIEVVGKYNTFVEPYVKIGATKSEIKALEKRSLDSEENDRLVYNDSNSKVDFLMYSFENGKLKTAGIVLKLFATDATELGKFLRERYEYIGESDGMLLLRDGQVAVAVKVEKYGIAIVYIKDTVGKATKSTDILNNSDYKMIMSKLKELKK